MTARRFRWGAAVVFVTSTTATAGPAWVEPEDEDAGALPAGAQVTVGEGDLTAIIGSLGGVTAATGQPDLHDMFFIFIDDPDNFRATTTVPGMAGFNSRLFLFAAIPAGGGDAFVGQGLLGNDNAGGNAGGTAWPGDAFGACCYPDGTCDEVGFSECTVGGGVFQGDGVLCSEASCTGSTLGNASTDGTPVVVDQPGLYLLTITISPQDPRSDEGIMFYFAQPDEVSGPDGPGGAEPIETWGEGFTECGDPKAGDCCGATGSPSCDNLDCCIEVCITDPFCCILEWDGDCAGLAFDLCPEICDPGIRGGDRDFGDYTIYLEGSAFSAEPVVVPIDIQPGQCANTLNLQGQGMLMVSILGTLDFDVSGIDLMTVRLTGSGEGLGFVAPAALPFIADTGTPYPGIPCACHDLLGDGLTDVTFFFAIQDIVTEFELGAFTNGTPVPLVAGGLLLDGAPFGGVDCVAIVGNNASSPVIPVPVGIGFGGP